MAKLGINKDDQKRSNRGLVLKLVATQQCESRIDLARTTGLTKTAISQIVNRLIEKDLLVELEKNTSQELGRNPVRLGISPKAPLFAGISIGRGICSGVLCDIRMNIVKETQINREWENSEELIEDMYAVADRLLEGEERIEAIGVSSIGPVSIKEGRLLRPMYFNGVGDIWVRDLLEERYNLPVYFDHDNQNAALVEHLYGSGQGYHDILLVSVGKGVGCGILVDDRRMHSYTGYAPEIGHVSIDYRGIPCECGNVGCLERYVNTVDMTNKLRYVTRSEGTYAELCAADTPKEAVTIMNDAMHKLSMGILNTLNVLNSELVLLGMDCTCWPDRYIRMIESEINERKYGNKEIRIPVRKTRFGQKSQLLGAACNAVTHTLYGE